MTDKEQKCVEMTTIYELRLLIDGDEKENYSKEELLKLLDSVARAKEQEMLFAVMIDVVFRSGAGKKAAKK